MKKIIILLLAIVMCLTFVGCNLDSRKGKITYEPVTLAAINEEFEQNAIRAEEKYVGKYVRFTCYVADISTYKITFSEKNGEVSNWTTLLDYECHAKVNKRDDSLIDKVKNLNKGDQVLVGGKITSLFRGFATPCTVYIDLYEVVVQ